MIKSILPANEAHWLKLRETDITSTESSALFNCSPYCTKFELWHRKKKNLASNFEANERTDWGLFLQDGIMAKFSKDNNWESSRKIHYITDTEARLGASFDYDVKTSIPRSDNKNISDVEFGLAEVKNVDSAAFKQGWIVDNDGYVEAPPHIEIQVQQQLMLSKLPFNYILALVGGNRGFMLKRLPNLKIFNAITMAAESFWKSIHDNIEPKPFDVDADFICDLYGYSEKGNLYDARGNNAIAELVALYKEYQQAEVLATTNKKIIKSRILPLIGTADKVLVDGGYSISCGMTETVEIAAQTRSGYRRFAIYGKGDK